MSVRYRDGKHAQSRRSLPAPLLVLVAVIGGLLWLTPQTTGMFASAVTNVLRLPVN
jgi:hypothetical protein